MKHTALLLLASATAACARYGVVVDVDLADGVDDDSAVVAAFYADDGDGCAGQRFVAAPRLTLIAESPLPLDGLELPRVGNKLVVVEARQGGAVVGRGCAELGDIDDVVTVRVEVRPTHRLVDVSAASLVIGDASVLDDGSSEAFADSVSAQLVTSTGVPARGAVAARLFAADGVVVVDDVLDADAASRVVFAPARAPAGPVRTALTPENPATDEPIVGGGFAVPQFILRDTLLQQLRPFVWNDVPVFAGVALAPPRLVVVDGVDVSALLTAVGSLDVVGVVRGADGADAFLVVADGVLVAVDADGDVVVGDEFAVDARARFFSAASCAGPQTLPGVISDGVTQTLVDVRAGALVTEPLTIANVVTSSCVRGDDGALHRLVVFGGDRPGVLDLGDGLVVGAELEAVPIVRGLENAIALLGRDDGLLLSSEADAGEVLVRLRRLSGDALVDAGAPPARLPSPPTFLASGNFFGGATDLFAVLSLGTAVRPDLAALYGVGQSGVSGGVVAPACAPAIACSDALAADVDGDGFLEVLTSVDGVAVFVFFR